MKPSKGITSYLETGIATRGDTFNGFTNSRGQFCKNLKIQLLLGLPFGKHLIIEGRCRLICICSRSSLSSIVKAVKEFLVTTSLLKNAFPFCWSQKTLEYAD